MQTATVSTSPTLFDWAETNKTAFLAAQSQLSRASTELHEARAAVSLCNRRDLPGCQRRLKRAESAYNAAFAEMSTFKTPAAH